MTGSDNGITQIYSIKFLWIALPFLGVFISALFMLENTALIFGSAIRHLLCGVLTTAALWLGCLYIVTYLWRRYPWEHHPIKHLVIEVVVIFTYTLLLSMGVDQLIYWSGLIVKPVHNFFHESVTTVLITFLITALHEAVFFYRQWKFNFSQSVKLQKQQLEAQYEILKVQMNPHFMFNSLNNLVSIVDDNPLAVDYINQMSAFLRYMIKSRDQELVMVEEEMHMLQKYIYLHQIRFGTILKVDLHVEDNVMKYRIPPLVLQMLVENCMKHNVVSRNKPLRIRIQSTDHYMVIENNINFKHQPETTGLGLNNIIERYRYFTSEAVHIRESENAFKVEVPLIDPSQ